MTTKADLTLKQVRENLQQWRDARQYKAQRIPNFLLAEIATLAERYSHKDIRRELTLTSQKLENIISEFPSSNIEGDQPSSSPSIESNFVEIPWSTVLATCSLELSHPNGTTLQIKDCPEPLLSKVISTFVHPSCSK